MDLVEEDQRREDKKGKEKGKERIVRIAGSGLSFFSSLFLFLFSSLFTFLFTFLLFYF